MIRTFWGMEVKQKIKIVMTDISCEDLLTQYSSNHAEVFLGKDVLKICSRFTEEHPYLSAISKNLQGNFIEIALRHGCSPVNLMKIFWAPFPKNTSGQLLLKIITWHITCYMNLVEAMIWHQQFHLACRESPTIALSHHVKIKENH